MLHSKTTFEFSRASQLFGNQKQILEVSVIALIVVCLAWVLAWYLQVAWTIWPDFDGALNFNVAVSVAEGRGYGSFYERWAYFPIETQTNGPLVLPTAFMLRLFGPQPFAFQLVNLAYVLALCGLVILLLRRVGAGWLIALAAAFAVVQAPGMASFAMFGYGEVAAVCWALAALWLLAGQVTRPGAFLVAVGGTLLGMSFLTKTVSLIWFPSIAGLFLFFVFWQHGWRTAMRMAVAGVMGVALPLIAWEIYRAITLGGPSAYRFWWVEQLLEIRKQAGVKDGYSDTYEWRDKLRSHGSALAGFLHTRRAVLLIAALAAAVTITTALWEGRRDPIRLYVLAVCSSVAAIYLYWWLLITPTEMMWLRRIMLGLVFVQISLAVAIALLWKTGSNWRLLMACVSVALLAWTAWADHLLFDRPDRRNSARAEMELAQALKEIPQDALIFGSGWWQAPVVALLSGRSMHNEEAWDSERLSQEGLPAYLVLDHYALNMGADLRSRLAWRCDCEPVFVGAAGRIFRIRALNSPDEPAVFGVLRFGPEAPIFGSGFSSEDEGGFRWAEDRAVLELGNLPVSSGWVLDLTVPTAANLGLKRGEQIKLELSFIDCPSKVHYLDGGPHSLLISPSCSPDSDQLLIKASHRILPARLGADQRRLAWVFRGLELNPLREP